MEVFSPFIWAGGGGQIKKGSKKGARGSGLHLFWVGDIDPPAPLSTNQQHIFPFSHVSAAAGPGGGRPGPEGRCCQVQGWLRLNNGSRRLWMNAAGESVMELKARRLGGIRRRIKGL